MRSQSNVELFEPADIKSTQFLLAIKFDSTRVCLSRFYKSRTASSCYVVQLSLALALAAWAGYNYEEYPSPYWSTAAFGSLCVWFAVDIALRAFATEFKCGVMSALDVIIVACVSLGFVVGLSSHDMSIVGTAAAVSSGLYPLKHLFSSFLSAACRSEIGDLRINESYSMDSPRNKSYIEVAPDEIKPSEGAILCLA